MWSTPHGGRAGFKTNGGGEYIVAKRIGKGFGGRAIGAVTIDGGDIHGYGAREIRGRGIGKLPGAHARLLARGDNGGGGRRIEILGGEASYGTDGNTLGIRN